MHCGHRLGRSPADRPASEKIETTRDRVRQQKISILLVEQDAFSALGLASRSSVLDNGRVAMEADSRELLQNSEFKRIYMGL